MPLITLHITKHKIGLEQFLNSNCFIAHDSAVSSNLFIICRKKCDLMC